MIDHARAIYPLVVRDLIAGLGAREDYDALLEHLGRRRAALYVNPQGPAVGEQYWPAFAAALAPEVPPAGVPMRGLVELGFTLEGGAKGLRGLFTRAPSDKERRRVLKIATLAARVMELVAGAERELGSEEGRLMAMAMASFGLSPEELAQAKPAKPVTFENVEVFGELEHKARRELLRGAWQLAFAGAVTPQTELVVRGIAARLEVSAETDLVRAEVVEADKRRGETALVALELVRLPARSLPRAVIGPWLEHLLLAAAPPLKRTELRALLEGSANAPSGEALPRMDSARRRAAVALAVATLLGPDPAMSVALHLRAELRAGATAAGVGGDFDDGLAVVDRYLFDRVRDAAAAPPPPAQTATTPALDAPATPAALPEGASAERASEPAAPSEARKGPGASE